MELTQEQQKALSVLMNNKTTINLDKHFQEELERIKEIEVEIQGFILDLKSDFDNDQFTTNGILSVARQLVDFDDERDLLKREIRKAKELLTSLGLM
jgi:hypothetical protein